MNEPQDRLFEINDPEIDVDQIMAQIRIRIEERRAALGPGLGYRPAFGAAPYPEQPGDIDYDQPLYYHLRLANEQYTAAVTGPHIAPSPATRMPVLGRLWALVREQAHGLVLFYVNRQAAQQVNVDRHIISALNRLTALATQQQRQIGALQAEINALRADKVG